MSILDERYDIESEVGRGPSAYVFRAVERASSKLVAIKNLETGDARAQQFPYGAEWDKILSLNSPYIVKAIDHFEEDGDRFIVSEFIKGDTLQQHLTANGPLPEADCISLFRALCLGLGHAHEQGLLHLNIKPSNVFLDRDENGYLIGKLADFGQWTMGVDQGPQSAQMAFYKSPEQRRGSGIMVASDIYALGKLLYVAISGEMDGRITPTALPEQCYLQEIIYCCIRTRMEDRYQSAHDMVQNIDRIEAEHFADGAEPRTDGTGTVSGGHSLRTAQPDVTVTAQQRANSEVQSMIIACRSHLGNRKLITCRKLMEETYDTIDKYADFQAEQWADDMQAELVELEEELIRKEKELTQMVASAEEAFNDARYEDVQMLATAAAEVSSERTGCENLSNEAGKALANIQTFMEDAFKSFKLKEYRRAEIDLIKVLEINPNHVSALQMRTKIKTIVRRKKIIGLALKTVPILVIVLGGFGSYFYFQRDYHKQVKSFVDSVESGRAKDAENAALEITKRHKLLKALFGDYDVARTFISDREAAKISYSNALDARVRFTPEELQDESIKPLVDHGAQLLTEAEANLNSAKSEEAKRLAEEAKAKYEQAFISVVAKNAERMVLEGRWQEAHDRLKVAYEVQSDPKIEKLYTLTLQKLVPELTVTATVGGKRAAGALILINGKIQKKVTPAQFLLDTGMDYAVTILLPPRGDKYYKPVTQTVRFESKEAKLLAPELEVIPGPAETSPWTLKAIDLTFMPVPSGSFEMGSDTGAVSERPMHSVTISKPFWMSKHEITRAQYIKVMSGETPGDDDKTYPANKLLWSKAMEFCRKVTLMERRNNRVPVNYEYRLPTEAEWEYVCQTGAKDSADINSFAWHAGNSGGNVKEIGTRSANSLGIHDLQGNVAEWCIDNYSSSIYSSRKSGVKDPVAPAKGTSYVIRGGSYKSPPQSCQSHVRASAPRKERSSEIGFRIVLAPIVKGMDN